MLVSCGMKDDLRMVGFHYIKDFPAVSDGSDDGLHLQKGEFLANLQLDVISIVFIDVKDDQLLWTVLRDLPAYFRTDGSASAGDQDYLPLEGVIDFLHIDMNRISAQEILHRDLLQGTDGQLPGVQLI